MTKKALMLWLLALVSIVMFGACDLGYWGGPSVSGKVVSATTGNGVPGVKLTAKLFLREVSMLTDENGNFYVQNAPRGTFIVTPSKQGYTFAPAFKTIIVGFSNITNLNFTAIPDEIVIATEPEVTLPPEYNAEDLTVTPSEVAAPSVIEISGSNFQFVPAGEVYDVKLTNQDHVNFGDEFAVLRFEYDKVALAEKGLSENFTVLYYDEQDGAWHAVDSIEIDAANSVVIAYVSHFTPFVLTALPAPPAGGDAPAQVTDLRAFPGKGIVTLTWMNPIDPDFAGVVIRRSTTSAPDQITEGDEPSSIKYYKQYYQDNSVVPNTTYYYTVFTLDTDNNWQTGEQITVTTLAETDNIPTWSKFYTYGANTVSQATGLTQTADGGFVFPGMTMNADGTYLLWAVKTDVNGNKIWEMTYPAEAGLGLEYPYAIIQTFDGGYAMTGIAMSQASEYTFFVAKLKADGALQWKKNYGVLFTEQTQALRIQQTIDEGYVIAGMFLDKTNSIDLAFVMKLQADGGGSVAPAHDWINYYRHNTNSRHGILSVIQALGDKGTTDNGYVICGYTQETNDSDEDLWVQKIQPDGTAGWSKSFDNAGRIDIATTVIQTADDDYFISGISQTYGESASVWILRLEEQNGNQNASAIYDNPDLDDNNCVPLLAAQTYDKGYVLAGGKTVTIEDTNKTYFWLLKLNPNGEKNWSKSYDPGMAGNSFPYALTQTFDGGYALGGIAATGGSPVGWVIKVDEDGNL